MKLDLTTVASIITVLTAVFAIYGFATGLVRRTQHWFYETLMRALIELALQGGTRAYTAKSVMLKIQAIIARLGSTSDIRLEFKTKQVATVPAWAFFLLKPEDAERYALEWSAHLRQLIEEGHLKQARADRRRLVRAAIFIAVALWIRRALKTARSDG